MFEREPGLDPRIHQAEGRMNEGVVDVKTLRHFFGEERMKLGVAWTVDRDGSIHCMLHIPRRTRVGRSLGSRDSKWRPPSIPKNGRMPQAKSGARARWARLARPNRGCARASIRRAPDGCSACVPASS